MIPENKENKIELGIEALKHNEWYESVAEDIKASRKSDDTDDPLDELLFHPASIRLAHVFIRHGVSANAVTLLSLLFGVSGSLLFFPQNRWITLAGIVCEIIAAILDNCDGQIARLTHTCSQFGRVLDGMTDITNFLAVYIVIGIRMTAETIPFTNTAWSFYIWPLLLLAMLCHAGQARMADYYRGLHLYFLEGSDSSTLARSRDLKAELAALPKGSPLYERVYRLFYLIYTKDQERHTPRAQRLLSAIEAKGGAAPELAEAYVVRSRRYIQLTNVLTYNIRAFSLYILLLLGLHAFYFPLVIVLLEAVKWYMIMKYEGIAEDVRTEYCADGKAQ